MLFPSVLLRDCSGRMMLLFSLALLLHPSAADVAFLHYPSRSSCADEVVDQEMETPPGHWTLADQEKPWLRCDLFGHVL